MYVTCTGDRPKRAADYTAIYSLLNAWKGPPILYQRDCYRLVLPQQLCAIHDCAVDIMQRRLASTMPTFITQQKHVSTVTDNNANPGDIRKLCFPPNILTTV